jgi:hypothetical protein
MSFDDWQKLALMAYPRHLLHRSSLMSRCRKTIQNSAQPDIALAKRELSWSPKIALRQRSSLAKS